MKCFGGAAEFPLEGFKEVGIIVKAALHAGFGGRETGADQVSGGSDPLLDDISIDRHTGAGFELVGQVILADKTQVGQPFQGQVAGKVFVNVGEHLVDFFIFQILFVEHAGPGKISPVQIDQKFQQVDVRQCIAAESFFLLAQEDLDADLFQAG